MNLRDVQNIVMTREQVDAKYDADKAAASRCINPVERNARNELAELDYALYFIRTNKSVTVNGVIDALRGGASVKGMRKEIDRIAAVDAEIENMLSRIHLLVQILETDEAPVEIILPPETAIKILTDKAAMSKAYADWYDEDPARFVEQNLTPERRLEMISNWRDEVKAFSVAAEAIRVIAAAKP